MKKTGKTLKSPMEIIDEIPVQRRNGGEPAAIQLLAGNLAAIPLQHAVDLLVVSAFPGSYTPNEGTLFAALNDRGLDMQDVARRKAEDERARLGCWLSKPLPARVVKRFRFKRILCFEPRDRPEDAVSSLFRCLNNFIIPDRNARRRYGISSVAMPLLATGNRAVPLEEMFPRLLEAAAFWLEEGLPIKQLKIVAYGEPATGLARRMFAARARRNLATETRPAPRPAQVAAADRSPWESKLAEAVSRELIAACQRDLRRSLLKAADGAERKVLNRVFDRQDALSLPAGEGESAVLEPHDVFVSYSHKDLTAVTEFVKALGRITPQPVVFFDQSSIRSGDQWLREISDAVEKARIFVAILSPGYSESAVCWDEFQCAKLKESRSKQSIIRMVRLRAEKALPLIMGIHSYIDCAPGNLSKLRAAAAKVMSLKRPARRK